MLCARAVEPPTDGPPRCPSARPSRRGALCRLGLEHAPTGGEARIRLLIAQSLWPFAFGEDGFSEEDARAARDAGEEAVELALKIDRPDLASGALDGIVGTDFVRGLHGRNLPVTDRRLEISSIDRSVGGG